MQLKKIELPYCANYNNASDLLLVVELFNATDSGSVDERAHLLQCFFTSHSLIGIDVIMLGLFKTWALSMVKIPSKDDNSYLGEISINRNVLELRYNDLTVDTISISSIYCLAFDADEHRLIIEF